MIVIIMISLILYIIIAKGIYHAIPELPKEKKLIYIIIGFIIVFFITYILTDISAITEDKSKQSLKIAKHTAIYLMAPINSFVLMPIGNSISKCKEKIITKEKLNKKLIIYSIIFIVCMIMEKTYIQKFIQGLLVSVT